MHAVYNLGIKIPWLLSSDFLHFLLFGLSMKALRVTESVVVWRHLTRALMAEDWNAARVEKARVESTHRAIRAERKVREEVWVPTMWSWNGSDWEWMEPKLKLPPAPLVALSPTPL